VIKKKERLNSKLYYFRQNGYYPDPDPAVCDSFFFCTEGKANPLTCSRYNLVCSEEG